MKRLITFLTTMLLLLMLVPTNAGATDFYVKKYDGWTPYLHIFGSGFTNTSWPGIKGETLVKEAGTNNYWYKITYDTGNASKVTLIVNKGNSQDQSDRNGYQADVKAALCVDWNGNNNGQISNVTDATGKTFTAYDPREEYYIHYDNGTSAWGDVHFNAEGKAELTLEGKKTYNFGIKKNGSDTWYTNGGTMTSTNCTNWTFNGGNGNAGITTTNAGLYIFSITLNGDVPSLSVTYPSGGSIDIPVSGIDPNAYYFVITKAGEEDRWLKMAPSRKRGGGEVLSDRWSFNIQNFMVEKYKDADGLHYYIIKGDKSRKYTPHSNNNNYELGLKNNTQGSNNNCGNVKAYEFYESTQNENNCTFKLDNTNNSYNGVSYTWLFDSQACNLEILVNKTRMGQADDPAEGYYLVGNFLGKSATDAIEPQKTDNRRSMDKYFYKNGLAYPAATAGITEAEADSVVYRVTVAKPKGQTTWGNLYLVVFRKKNVDSWPANPSDGEKVVLWKNAIRPQEQWNYGTNYEGLDATATHGGLYMRKSDAGDTQQALNPSISDDIESYTFSMNVTTSTYRITFNQKLYILGPAIYDGDEESGWSTANPDNQTKNAYKLVYDTNAQCYTYRGGDNKTLADEEQPIHLVAGRPFAFAYNKNFTNTFFEENDVIPVDLSGTRTDKATSNEERRAYNVNEGDNRYETQYVNFLRTGAPLSSADHDNTVRDCTFNLPTGDYYIRLYIRVSAVNPDLSQVFYTIRRKYTFTSQHQADEIDGKNTYKTFCDYHAIVLPDNVDAWYITSADKATKTVTYTNYPLYNGDNGQRVLPAGAPVILVAKNEDASVNKPTFDIDYYAQPNLNEKNIIAPTTNLLKGQVHSANVPKVDGDKANFLFACQKRNASDSKPTIGFYIPGVYDCPPINLAYLQLDKNFLDGNTASNSKGWTFVFDNTVTGIDNINSDVNKLQNDDAYYTIQGVKVNAPNERGIYIHNGKKIIIK